MDEYCVHCGKLLGDAVNRNEPCVESPDFTHYWVEDDEAEDE